MCSYDFKCIRVNRPKLGHGLKQILLIGQSSEDIVISMRILLALNHQLLKRAFDHAHIPLRYEVQMLPSSLTAMQSNQGDALGMQVF